MSSKAELLAAVGGAGDALHHFNRVAQVAETVHIAAHDEGAHVFAMEQPAAFTDDARSFLRSLR